MQPTRISKVFFDRGLCARLIPGVWADLRSHRKAGRLVVFLGVPLRVGERKITHPEGAELQMDTAPADWIADQLLPWGSDVGTRVCAIVPTGYEAYLRVFYHAEERVGSESIRRRWSELAQRSGRQMHPAVQFARFAWPDPPQEGPHQTFVTPGAM